MNKTKIPKRLCRDNEVIMRGTYLSNDIYLSYNVGYIVTWKPIPYGDKHPLAGEMHFPSEGLTFLGEESCCRGIKKHYGIDVAVEYVKRIAEEAKMAYFVKEANRVKKGFAKVVKEENTL